MFGRKHTEKYLTFLVLIKKQENEKTIKYKIRFIDSVIFMASSLSSLIDNLAEALGKSKRKDCKSSIEYSQRWFPNMQVCGLQQNL